LDGHAKEAVKPADDGYATSAQNGHLDAVNALLEALPGDAD
jgi:hypothetical protein